MIIFNRSWKERNADLRDIFYAMALSLLLNGERAVVLIYVARILFFTPESLLLEAFSLACLSVFALYVEILADGDGNHIAQSFKTRPGASSGILLGSITVPGLQLSKLIQILRAVSSNSVAIEDLEYLKLQYWAASVSCFTVLLFLCLISWRHQESVNRIQYIFGWNYIYSFICLSCLVAFGLVSFTGKLYGAEWYIWIVLHGLAAVKLIEKILHTFPACSSIGESLLVTSGLVIYIGDMFAYTAFKISYLASFTTLFGGYGFKRSEISTIIQGTISGLLLLPLVYKYTLQISTRCTGNAGNYETRKSYVFYAWLALILGISVPSWMQFVHGFPMHPFLWVLNFVLSDPVKRVTLCIYWMVIMCVSVRSYDVIKRSIIT